MNSDGTRKPSTKADHVRLGIISWILIMTLFVVRASTMGAMRGADDV